MSKCSPILVIRIAYCKLTGKQYSGMAVTCSGKLKFCDLMSEGNDIDTYLIRKDKVFITYHIFV